jgi:hypothetical protein
MERYRAIIEDLMANGIDKEIVDPDFVIDWKRIGAVFQFLTRLRHRALKVWKPRHETETWARSVAYLGALLELLNNLQFSIPSPKELALWKAEAEKKLEVF